VFVAEGIMAVGQSVPPQQVPAPHLVFKMLNTDTDLRVFDQIAALLSALSSPVAARLKALIQSQLVSPQRCDQ
jgi:hypothetical protein